MEDPVETAEGVVSSDQRADRDVEPPTITRPVRDRLVRLAYRFVWNVDDAEDVVHEALAATHARIKELRDKRKWWWWVCRIVVRRCHEHGRRKLRRERHDQKLRLAATQEQRPPHEPLSEGTEIVRRLVLQLPRRQKEVIVLRHIHGMGFEEIAQVLGISCSTARVHARSGRETLRTLLIHRHPDWCDTRGSNDGARR